MTKSEKHGPTPQFLDIGCGYGGLMFQLTKAFPDKLILGLEIRDKVANYVGEKINSIRCNS
jgi:tRNA (guanine-N7-)-methyltransferase